MIKKFPKYLSVIRCHGLGHNNGFYLTDKEPKDVLVEILLDMKKKDIESQSGSIKQLNEENLKTIVEKSVKEVDRANTPSGETFYVQYDCDESQVYSRKELSELIGFDSPILWALTYQVDFFNIDVGSEQMKEDIQKDLGNFGKDEFISKYEIKPHPNDLVQKLGL